LGKHDPNKAELVIEDKAGKLWDYTGPIEKIRAHGEGIATREGNTYTGHFDNGKFDGDGKI